MEQTAAEKTNFLEERIKQNESNQSLDLNKWAFSNIEPSDTSLNILELCCGTGKQTEYLAKHFPNSTITAVDISPDAIKILKESSLLTNVKGIASGIDQFLDFNSNKYDLVFVSYGLYYAYDLDKTINQIISILNPEGKFIVLGPYGKNNKALFDLVISSNVRIDDFVMYSCTEFMYDKVLKLSFSNFKDIQINTAINVIKWKNINDVVTYWKNTTFFDETKKDIFELKLKDHFAINDTFNNEKHIMLFQGLKKI